MILFNFVKRFQWTSSFGEKGKGCVEMAFNNIVHVSPNEYWLKRVKQGLIMLVCKIWLKKKGPFCPRASLRRPFWNSWCHRPTRGKANSNFKCYEQRQGKYIELSVWRSVSLKDGVQNKRSSNVSLISPVVGASPQESHSSWLASFIHFLENSSANCCRVKLQPCRPKLNPPDPWPGSTWNKKLREVLENCFLFLMGPAGD